MIDILYQGNLILDIAKIGWTSLFCNLIVVVISQTKLLACCTVFDLSGATPWTCL